MSAIRSSGCSIAAAATWGTILGAAWIRPVIFAFHGYPSVIHKLTYRRHNHDNIHVRGKFLVGPGGIASDFVHEQGRKVGEIMTPNRLTTA
jgi:hypothetical protein